MKKIVYFSSILCLLALTVIISNNLFGQYDYVNDPDFPDIFEEDEHFDYPFEWTENSSSTNGYVHTPHGHIHMLVIFVGYTNTTSADDVGTPGTPSYWAHNDIPNWAKGDNNELFSKNIGEIGSIPKNLSSFYYTASQGNFLVTGEVFPEQIPVDPGQWQSAAINWIANNPDYDNYNWGRFDNRTNRPAYDYDNSTSDPDFKIDYVNFVFRNFDGASAYAGINGPYNITTNYGGTTLTYTLQDGHTYIKTSEDAKHSWIMFKHEFAHNLYTCAHIMGANPKGGDGKYYYIAKGRGLMAAWHQQFDLANAWESWWLGWIEPQEITQNGIYTIGDYVGSGDVIRIPIPNTDEQYLWIENHQKVINYPFSGYEFDEKPYYNPPPTDDGLFMFITATCDDREDPGEMSVYDLNAVNMIKPLNAQGNFDFYYDGLEIAVPNAGTQKVFGRTQENPIAGQNTYQMIRWDYDDNGTIDVAYHHGNNTPAPYNEISEVWAEYIEGIATPTYASTGNENDGFHVGDEIGLSGIVPAINYPLYIKSEQRLNPYILNGLSVKVLALNNGTYTLDIKFNDTEIRDDKRWCGDINVGSPIASNYSVDIASGVKVTLDESGTPNRETLLNGKFVNPTVLTCIDNAYFHMQNSSGLDIIQGSKLILKDNSIFEIESSSNINLADYSEITVEEGSQLIIHDYVTFSSTSGICKIIVNGNIQIGTNVKFLGLNDSQLWLKINNTALNVTIDQSEFLQTAIIAYNNKLSISNSTLTSSGLYGFNGDFDISKSMFNTSFVNISNANAHNRTIKIGNQCEFGELQNSAAITINNYPNYLVENCSISSCSEGIKSPV